MYSATKHNNRQSARRTSRQLRIRREIKRGTREVF